MEWASFCDLRIGGPIGSDGFGGPRWSVLKESTVVLSIKIHKITKIKQS